MATNLKPTHLRILLNPLSPYTLRQHHMSLLQIPPQHQLRRRASVFFAQLDDGGVVHFPGSGEGRVGLDDDVVRGAVGG